MAHFNATQFTEEIQLADMIFFFHTGFYLVYSKFIMSLISNFCCVLNVVFFLLGDSPESEFQMPGNHPKEGIQQIYNAFPIHSMRSDKNFHIF